MRIKTCLYCGHDYEPYQGSEGYCPICRKVLGLGVPPPAPPSPAKRFHARDIIGYCENCGRIMRAHRSPRFCAACYRRWRALDYPCTPGGRPYLPKGQ